MTKTRTNVKGLPTTVAWKLPKRPEAHRWLIKDLWGDEAVGIVGGEPKCCKSFMALAMAVSVASGTPCLGQFEVTRTGRVLVYAAEDALHTVRERLVGIAIASGVRLADLDIHVITARTVRLDIDNDREALAETIKILKPKLLVLDPFVRLHRIDENNSGEVAPLLGFLREMQRKYNTAVVLVHHARKGGKKMRGGQALRGSSEFHAWGDSNLYLRRHDKELTMTVEHRAAASIGDLYLQLESKNGGLALQLAEPTTIEESVIPPTLKDKIITYLRAATEAVSQPILRKHCQVRNATLVVALNELITEKLVEKTADGFVPVPVPAHP